MNQFKKGKNDQLPSSHALFNIFFFDFLEKLTRKILRVRKNQKYDFCVYQLLIKKLITSERKFYKITWKIYEWLAF